MPSELVIRQYEDEDQGAVISVWQRCGLVVPWNDPAKDIRRKLALGRDLFLVGAIEGQVVATAMAGYDGHRGWINYLAVAPEHQRRGYARKLVADAEARLRSLGCPKINVQIRASNRRAVAFYERIGFRADDVLSMGKRLESDGPPDPETHQS